MYFDIEIEEECLVRWITLVDFPTTNIYTLHLGNTKLLDSICTDVFFEVDSQLDKSFVRFDLSDKSLNTLREVAIGNCEEDVLNRSNFIRLDRVNNLRVKSENALQTNTITFVLNGLFCYNGVWTPDSRAFTSTTTLN